MNRKKKINVFTVTFDEFNASMLNKRINFFQINKCINLTDQKVLNGNVHAVFTSSLIG